jgi:hypothetical protein
MYILHIFNYLTHSNWKHLILLTLHMARSPATFQDKIFSGSPVLRFLESSDSLLDPKMG